jgi:type IV secretory pathway protease TraF
MNLPTIRRRILLGLKLFSLSSLILLITMVLLMKYSPVYIQVALSHSLYDHVFLMSKCDSKGASKGSLVSFNIDKPDFYPDKYWPKYKTFLKELTGLPGDSVVNKDSYLLLCPFTNAQFQKNLDETTCKKLTRVLGLPFSIQDGNIPEGYFFGNGYHPLSVDSRYFGLIALGDIKACGRPIF